jgi:phospholipid-binding lipoprotein MlaA
MSLTARVRIDFPFVCLMCIALCGCASQAPLKRDPRDPLERMNRVTYAVNDKIDRAIAKPLAKAYRRVTPHFVQRGVSNFMDNLHYPVVLANDILQLKLKASLSDVGRLVLNTAFGIGGLFDPASDAGLAKNDEDFGLTLGHWGVHPGPYLVIPVLGPSDFRDGFGKLADGFVDPANYIKNDAVRYGLYGVYLIDRRARYLDVENSLNGAFDRYAVLRNVYLQHRQYRVTGESESVNPVEDELPDPDAK